MPRRPIRALTVLLASALCSACARHPGATGTVGGVTVASAVAWGFPGSGSLTVGCRITSRVPDSLIAVSTPVAAHAQLHNVITSGGISRMVAVSAVPLSPNAAVRLGAGGYHVMLDSLRAEIAVGDTVDVTWEFARAGRLTLRVPVVKFGDAQKLLTP